ncbi:hypothetical protein V6N11_042781 [Hibiscus sabdariffa]|uniref:CCHC-type domain-containing protein n=1 Tax=Hibiscus sabdariffa TaxID=183260 RepID=A0ABR2QXH2_9ROSI
MASTISLNVANFVTHSNSLQKAILRGVSNYLRQDMVEAEKTIVYYLLANLGQQYEYFTMAMLKPLMPSYSEAMSLLQGNISQQLQKVNNHTPRPPPPGKRRMTSTKQEMYKNEQCQLCGRLGHIAKICWSLPNQSVLTQSLATLIMDTSVPDVEWTTDIGASNHMTTNSLGKGRRFVGWWWPLVFCSCFVGAGWLAGWLAWEFRQIRKISMEERETSLWEFLLAGAEVAEQGNLGLSSRREGQGLNKQLFRGIIRSEPLNTPQSSASKTSHIPINLRVTNRHAPLRSRATPPHMVSVLLKECRDIQLRFGPVGHDSPGDDATVAPADMRLESNAGKVISEMNINLKL